MSLPISPCSKTSFLSHVVFFSTHKLQILINHKASESPIALKLICAMLDYTDYKHFEGLADLTHSTFEV